MTFHRAQGALVCHYCGARAQLPERCATCGAPEVEQLGLGTERVEALVKQRFPSARVARIDRDSAGGRALPRLLESARRGEIDILVGTQMLAKGHDFPGVTLVGVVLADHGMGLPDFRAAERTFQLLEQVAGRAGRGERAGRVLVQTYNPLHPAVTCMRDHAYNRFVDQELHDRRELCFPPASRLACIRVDGADPTAVRTAAEIIAASARAACARAPQDAAPSILGPAEAPLSRLKGRTRWQLFVKAKRAGVLRGVCRAALADRPSGAIRAVVDIDPQSML